MKIKTDEGSTERNILLGALGGTAACGHLETSHSGPAASLEHRLVLPIHLGLVLHKSLENGLEGRMDWDL